MEEYSSPVATSTPKRTKLDSDESYLLYSSAGSLSPRMESNWLFYRSTEDEKSESSFLFYPSSVADSISEDFDTEKELAADSDDDKHTVESAEPITSLSLLAEENCCAKECLHHLTPAEAHQAREPFL